MTSLSPSSISGSLSVWLRNCFLDRASWCSGFPASVVPMAFWFLSIGGGLMTLIYGIVRREPVIILGQALPTIIYTRNIMLIMKSRASGSQTLDR
jgi:Lipid A Biosynthesis N-terminal domain